MKTISKLPIFAATLAMAAAMTGCHNSDNEFPDFDYQTVYFANQTVGRTIELGRDTEIDLSADNSHCFKIMAVMGGAYSNNANRVINIAVDPTLCEDIRQVGGREIKVLPSNYYELESNTIVIPSGMMKGAVNVHLTDAFFADPEALDFNYVLPVLMTGKENVDSILEGKAAVENPKRTHAADWTIQPQDYVLYFVRYVNPWHGSYLRRGTDKLTVGGTTTEIVRAADDVIRDEQVSLTTAAYKECEVTLSTRTDADHVYSYTLLLTFDDNNKCTVSSATEGVTASGSGEFVIDGAKGAINGENRDMITLSYTVQGQGWSLQTEDSMVLRTRGIQASYPSIEVKPL